MCNWFLNYEERKFCIMGQKIGERLKCLLSSSNFLNSSNFRFRKSIFIPPIFWPCMKGEVEWLVFCVWKVFQQLHYYGKMEKITLDYRRSWQSHCELSSSEEKVCFDSFVFFRSYFPTAANFKSLITIAHLSQLGLLLSCLCYHQFSHMGSSF